MSHINDDWYHYPEIPEEVPPIDVLAELLAENKRLLIPLLRKAQAIKYLGEHNQQSEQAAYELLGETINRVEELFIFVEKIRPYLHTKIEEFRKGKIQNDDNEV